MSLEVDTERPSSLAAAAWRRRPSNVALLGSRTGRSVLHVLTFVVLMSLWITVSHVGLISPILLPTPFAIAERLGISLLNIVQGGFMMSHLLVTLQEILLGFAMAVVIGIGIGGMVTEFAFVRVLLMPYLIAFNATPRTALVPIVLIWFGFGITSKVIIAAMIATFPILVGTMAGLVSTERPALRLMRAYGATRWQIFRKVRMYDARPYIFAGLETGIVFATIGAIVAEFLGGSQGLGYVIVVAQESLDLPYAFSSLIILSIVGVILHRIVVVMRNKAVYWRPKDEGSFTRQAAPAEQ